MSYLGQQLGQGQAERFVFTASGGETSVTTSDDGRAIAYTVGQVDVYLNGAKLINGSDFTATTGTSITGLAALTASDVVEVFALSIFQASDTVSAASGGTFNGNVTVDANLSVTGTVDINGGNIDGTVIGAATPAAGSFTTGSFSGNVGIGTTSPSEKLHVSGAGRFARTTDATQYLNLTLETGNAVYNAAGSINHVWQNAGTEQMRLDTSGNVGIGTSSPQQILEVASDDYTVNMRLQSNINDTPYFTDFEHAGASGFSIKTHIFNQPTTTIQLKDGNVGIGTTSPTTALTVSTDGTEQLTINRADASINTGNTVGTILFTGDDPSANQTGARIQVIAAENWATNAYGSHITFSNDNSGTITERMRLDASGNLLVGKSVTTFNTTGFLYEAGAAVEVTRSGNRVMRLNRTTNDGSILEFNKDGGTVGSIGAYDGDIIVGTGTSRLRFFDGTPAILPSSSDTFGASDGAIDLGNSGRRFKDLYLSGGVYLGGTGAANLLDDYEEGTFTPTLANGTVTYNVQKGWYTKIGRVVTVNILVSWTALSGSGNFTVSGLPFVPFNTDSDYRFTGSLGYTQGVDFGGREFLTFTGNGGTSVMNLYANEDNATPTVINVSNCSAIGEVQITTTYITNA